MKPGRDGGNTRLGIFNLLDASAFPSRPNIETAAFDGAPSQSSVFAAATQILFSLAGECATQRDIQLAGLPAHRP